MGRLLGSSLVLLVSLLGGCGSNGLISRPDADADTHPVPTVGTGGLSGTDVAPVDVSTIADAPLAPIDSIDNAIRDTSLAATGGVSGSGGVAGAGGWLGNGGSGGRATGGSIGFGDGGSGGSSGSGGEGGSGGSAPGCTSNALVANALNNYAFSSTLTLPPIEVAANTELTFDWSGLTRDFIGHSLDPQKDINTILVFLWKLPLVEFENKVNSDTLLMKDLVTLPLEYATDGSRTSVKLFELSNTGLPTQEQLLGFMDPDVYPNDQYTFSLMAATGAEIGQGIRMIQSFTPSKNATTSTVFLTSDSAKLTWEAHIQQAKLTEVPVGEAYLTIDWGSMTTNAMGAPFRPVDAITEVVIGRYTESVAELERKFLDLELIATDLYRGTIDAGTRMDLWKLTTAAGKPFPGIDDTGTWLLALKCGPCRNSAPWYLMVLKPCDVRSCVPSENRVCFVNGKAEGAISGYGLIKLGDLDTVTSPVCDNTSNGGGPAEPITAWQTCSEEGDVTVWSRSDALCISGTIPVVGGGDGPSNWGIEIGVNVHEDPGVKLGKTYRSISFTFNEEAISPPISPTNTAIRGILHLVGDDPQTQYCAVITSGAPTAFTAFNTRCWPGGYGDDLTEADIPNIDRIGLEVAADDKREYLFTGFCLENIELSPR